MGLGQMPNESRKKRLGRVVVATLDRFCSLDGTDILIKFCLISDKRSLETNKLSVFPFPLQDRISTVAGSNLDTNL